LFTPNPEGSEENQFAAIFKNYKKSTPFRRPLKIRLPLGFGVKRIFSQCAFHSLGQIDFL
jgi:hypothetical protein